MSRRTSVLVVAIGAVLAMSLTQISVGAGKHSHKVPVKQYEVQIVTPPGGVNGEFVVCDPGYTATGGGTSYVDGLGLIASSGFGQFINQFEAIIDNFDSPFTSVMNVQVACVKGTKPAKGRIATRQQAEAALERKIETLRTMHRRAERR